MSNVTLTLTGVEAMAISVICLTIVLSLVASFIVAWINHRYTLAQGKKMAARWLHVTLLGISSLFVGLQYYTPWLQTHLRTLETLPYIGSYAVGIYAAANFLYAVKAKQWFQDILHTAEKLDAKSAQLPGLEVAPVVPSDESPANFSV